MVLLNAAKSARHANSVSESRVTWATSVPILVFLGLSVLDLGPLDVISQTDRRQTASLLNAPA